VGAKICATCGDPFPPEATQCPRDGSSIVLSDTQKMPVDPLIGKQLGDYLIEKQIGMGGMGIVYGGIQPQISKRVAIKVLRPDLAADPAQVQRLLAEAQAVNAIHHRSIIDIFGFGKVPDGRHYVVMELLEGEPLEELIERKAPMPPLEAIPLLDEILSALGAAHGRAVIHRDLKPSNVFVASQQDGSRYLKLLDFGLAKRSALPNARTAQTNDGSVSGTPDYMAPEQARGEAVGPETDLYALGIVAFQMLTGELPFTAATPIELLMKHLNTPAPTPSSIEQSVPSALDDLVLSLLAKEMSDRPRSADVVRASLKRISRELTDAATQVGAKIEPQWRVTGPHPAHSTTRVVSAPAKNWLPFAGAGLAGAIVFSAVAYFVFRPRPSEAILVEPPPAQIIAAPVPPTTAPVVAPPPPVVVARPEEPQPPPENPPPASKPGAAKGGRGVVSAKALQERIARLDKLIRKKAGPGEEPDAEALAFLNRKRLELTFPGSSDKLASISAYLDAWEKRYLR
jgi:serine/threonine protein kinase